MGICFKWKRRAGRGMACLLSCLLLMSGMGLSALGADAVKEVPTRAIGIVFDNSGSMYKDYNKAWCRATYAIEVFASMMNEGDTLQVYPMYPIEVDGKAYDSKDNPFTISGGDDTSVIQTMYSPKVIDTPIETIGHAHDGLNKLSADEKWLIVLTDGAEFYENEEPLGEDDPTKLRLEEVLTEYNRDMNVLYLGIDTEARAGQKGVTAVIPEVANNGAYQYYSARAANSADTLTRLTELCNMIFGRDQLERKGNQLTLDVSMRKLILFVQGTDISNVTLTDESGKSVGRPSLEYSPHYGELGVGSLLKDGTPYTKWTYDDSLSGYIAVYDTELDAGTYNLSYSGNVTSVSVYHEPYVSLKATLTDGANFVYGAGSELYPGTYYINYTLVDKYGNPAVSDQLGDIHYAVTYSVNGEETTVRTNESGRVQVELAAGDVLDGKINVTYLSGYSITKSAKDFNWPSGGFKTVERPAGALNLQMTGGKDAYLLTDVEEGVYDLSLTFEGETLTGSQLDSSELALALDGGNLTYELSRTDTGYTVALKHAGDAADTLCGPYTLRVAARFTDTHGVTATSEQVSIPFTVGDVGFTLSMEVDGGREYVISKLPESEPIVVTLAIDGKPLTDEQLAAVTLTADGEGLTLEQERLSGQSAIAVRVVKDDNAQKGRYDLTFRAETHDPVGRAVTAEGEGTVRLRTLPVWIPIVIAIAILLLIILLIWLYMNMKVLPKKIILVTDQTIIRVKGKQISGAAVCNYTGGGKKKGSLRVSIPQLVGYPLATGGFTLDLEAVSPRRTKSAQRRVKVVKISPTGTANLQSLSIGNHTLSKTGKLGSVNWRLDDNQVSGASPTTQFELGGRPVCLYSGITTLKEKYSMNVQLQFK